MTTELHSHGGAKVLGCSAIGCSAALLDQAEQIVESNAWLEGGSACADLLRARDAPRETPTE